MEKHAKDFEELLIAYFENNLSDEETREFSILLKIDEQCRQKYEEMAKLRAKSFIPRFESEKASNYAELIKKLSIPCKQKSFTLSPRQWFYRVAVILLLAVTTSTTAYYIYNESSLSEQASQLCIMEVPFGSQTKVYLPDGTVVCLNSGSTLKYHSSYAHKKTRDVYLSGEGYFEVKKNPGQPFIVHADQLKVRVLGTVFNVCSYHEDSEVEVDLVEGKVNVSLNADETKNITLAPDECMIYNKKRKEMRKELVDAKKMAQWTTGRLSFVNTSLATIMKDIERRYNVKIVIESEHVKNEIFSGSIDAQLTIDDVLEFIDVDKKYRWTRKGNVIVVQDKRK